MCLIPRYEFVQLAIKVQGIAVTNISSAGYSSSYSVWQSTSPPLNTQFPLLYMVTLAQTLKLPYRAPEPPTGAVFLTDAAHRHVEFVSTRTFFLSLGDIEQRA